MNAAVAEARDALAAALESRVMWAWSSVDFRVAEAGTGRPTKRAIRLAGAAGVESIRGANGGVRARACLVGQAIASPSQRITPTAAD